MAVEGEKLSVLFVQLQNTPVSFRGAVLLLSAHYCRGSLAGRLSI